MMIYDRITGTWQKAETGMTQRELFWLVSLGVMAILVRHCL
jgi:hypothetical protein